MSTKVDPAMEKQSGRSNAKRRLIYAGVLFVISFILYSISGGGPTSLLLGALSGVVNLAMIIFLLVSVFGFIKYR